MSSHDQLSWNLPLHWVEQSRKAGKRMRVADSTGVKLGGGDMLTRTNALQRVLRRHLAVSEGHVGVLLPPSVPAAVTNFALTLDGVTSVNLNYTASSAILNRCLETADVKHVITSRRVMEKLTFDLKTKYLYLEDLRDQITLLDKLVAVVKSKLFSANSLIARRDGKPRNGDDAVTVIFTSGSTGDPKGVVLTYENIASNIRSVHTALALTERDTIVGILPFFHSFGYTVSLWAPMALSLAAVYHYSPLDARQIGKLAQDFKATILLTTPTFLRNYLRRVEPEQFKTLELVVVGAEKEPIALSDAFEERFGVRPIEGYGMTEMGPLVSVNVPASRNRGPDPNSGLCEGSVGKPLPEVEAKFLSLEGHEPLGVNQDGMLYVRGKGLMPGYMKRQDLTDKAMRDGWYETGDIGHFDDHGFIHLTGRQSRFSKIGGEMVPHGLVEEAIHSCIGGTDDEGTVTAVVTAVPDEKRGERLIVLHRGLNKSPREIIDALTGQGLPNLYLPSEDAFIEVPEIPILGSGKLDLKAIRDLALEITTP